MKCPFDKECEDCHLQTKMFETNDEGKNEEVYRCALYWVPILLSEIKQEMVTLKQELVNSKEE